MENESYRDTLKESADLMISLGRQLFTCVINLAMKGELKDVDDAFSTGETLTYKEDDFRKLSDQNIQLIYEVLDVISKVHSSLVNINDISEDESEEGEDGEDDDLPF